MQNLLFKIPKSMLPINQSNGQLQCFECRGWGHKKASCPNKIAKKKTFQPPLPTQREAFLNRNKNQSTGQASTHPKNVNIHYVNLKEEHEDQATYSILEEPWNCEEGVTEGIEAYFEEKKQPN